MLALLMRLLLLLLSMMASRVSAFAPILSATRSNFASCTHRALSSSSHTGLRRCLPVRSMASMSAYRGPVQEMVEESIASALEPSHLEVERACVGVVSSS